MSDNATVSELERKIKELTELSRVVSNGLNWLVDVEIKVAYIAPVNEFVSFLQGFKANISQQCEALKSALPKEVKDENKAIIPEIVK